MECKSLKNFLYILKKFCITLKIWLSLSNWSLSSSGDSSSSATIHRRESSSGFFIRRRDWQTFSKWDNISYQKDSVARLRINFFTFLITFKVLTKALFAEFIIKKDELKFYESNSLEGFSLRSKKLVLFRNLCSTKCKWDIARTISLSSCSL